ncbi:hypothetical protein EVAR_2727_1 [Eumeta japonica]|uniref:Uncharacterized protein n=1 Tax=Eumeta variegata TaxID=151549 RepID=A0A4C1T279_EUMVA|nr:hypothetical protein EVAR_2727_1 [Eumeta japonica]
MVGDGFYCDRVTLRLIRLQYKNGSDQLMKYHTLIEYGREVAVFAVTFQLVSVSSDGSFSTLPFRFHQRDPPPLDILFTSKRVGIAPETSLGLRVSMGGGDHLLSDVSPT